MPPANQGVARVPGRSRFLRIDKRKNSAYARALILTAIFAGHGNQPRPDPVHPDPAAGLVLHGFHIVNDTEQPALRALPVRVKGMIPA